MPRRPSPLLNFNLTAEDTAFLDEVEITLKLIAKRVREVVSLIDPEQTAGGGPDYSRPAPAQLSYTFVPYGRELMHSTRAMRQICDLWTILKSLRGQITLPATADPALVAPGSRTQFETISHHLAETTRILSAAPSPPPPHPSTPPLSPTDPHQSNPNAITSPQFPL